MEWVESGGGDYRTLGTIRFSLIESGRMDSYKTFRSTKVGWVAAEGMCGNVGLKTLNKINIKPDGKRHQQRVIIG